MTNEMEVPATTQAKPKKQGFFGHYVKTKLKEASKNKTLYLFMLPFLVLFVIFTVMPVVTAIYYSFTYFNVLEPPQFIFWDNYVRMFVADDLFMTAFKNTLLFAAILGPCGYILSFFFAWLINEFSPKIRAVLTLIYYAPSLANIYVVWKLIFDSSNYGLLNGILMDLGLIYTNIRWLEDVNYIVGCVIVVLLWSSLGVSFLTFTAGLQNVDRSLYEAGAIDGVRNRWQELWYITIPSMSSQLLFSAVMQIGASFGVSTVITTLVGFPTSQYSADTIVTYIMDIGTTRFEMGYACTIAVFLFALMFLTNFVISSALRRFSPD